MFATEYLSSFFFYALIHEINASFISCMQLFSCCDLLVITIHIAKRQKYHLPYNVFFKAIKSWYSIWFVSIITMMYRWSIHFLQISFPFKQIFVDDRLRQGSSYNNIFIIFIPRTCADSAFLTYDIFRLLTFLQNFCKIKKKKALMLALELSTYEKGDKGNLMQLMSSKIFILMLRRSVLFMFMSSLSTSCLFK